MFRTIFQCRVCLLFLVGVWLLTGSASTALAQEALPPPTATDVDAASTAVITDSHGEWSLGLGFRFGQTVVNDRQLDPLTPSNTNTQLGLYVDYEFLDDLIVYGDRLRFGIEWFSDGTSETLYNTFNLEHGGHHVLATIDYGYHIFRWLTPYLRTGLGFGIYDFSLSSPSSNVEDSALTFSGQAGLGLEFLLPFDVMANSSEKHKSGIGVRTEFGLTFRTEPEYEVGRTGPTPEDEVDVTVVPTSLGSVPVNGWYWTTDLYLRF